MRERGEGEGGREGERERGVGGEEERGSLLGGDELGRAVGDGFVGALWRSGGAWVEIRGIRRLF